MQLGLSTKSVNFNEPLRKLKVIPWSAVRSIRQDAISLIILVGLTAGLAAATDGARGVRWKPQRQRLSNERRRRVK
jgi:hypothetical protein